MWVIAIIAIFILLLAVALAPKPNFENARAASLGDFQVPRAKYGDPVGLLWGTVRAKSPVAIWYGDLVPTPIKQKVPSGLFSSKKVVVGYKYNIGLDLCWCLGGRAGNTVKLKKLWAGKHVIWTGDLSADGTININLPNLFGGDKERGGLSGTIFFYNGGYSPARNTYLAGKVDPNIPAYNGFCRTVFQAFYVGTQTSIESFSAELSRMTNNLSGLYSIMPNGLDVNPTEILYDAITERWGRFGATADDIDLPSWTSGAQTLYNELNGMSLFVQSSISGKQLAEEVLRQADAMLYQDPATAKIVLKLIRNDYDVNTLPLLDESMVTDLKEFSKTTWEAALNQCRVTFKDRSNNYEDSSAMQQDFALINYQGRVKGTDISMPGVFDKTLANQIAARQLSFMNVPLFKVELACNRKASDLRPGMVRRFDWLPYGLSNLVLRILKVDLGELEDGTVRLTCIQDRFSTGTPVFNPPSNSGWTPPTTDPGVVATRRLYEAPYFFTRALTVDGVVPANRNSVYALANKPGSASMAYDLLMSTDAFVTASEVSDDEIYNGSGQLTALYPASAGFATGFDATGFSLNNVSGSENLVSYTLAQGRDGRALLLCEDEWMLYTTVSAPGTTATFTNVYRGLFDSAIVDHPLGARVWFVSEQDGLVEQLLAAGTYGFKMIDKAPSGSLDPTLAPIDNVILPSTTKSDRPYPPDYLQLNASRTPTPVVGATSVAATWRERNRKKADISVYNDASDTPMEAGTTYDLRYRIGVGSYTTIAGISGTSQAIPVTGLVGALEVRVASKIGGVASLTEDVLTINLS